jgi:hypothetical protein
MIHRICAVLRRKGSYIWPETFGVFTEFGSVTSKIAVFAVWGVGGQFYVA